MSDETQWTPNQVLVYVKDLLLERDKRYEQRFDAQESAVKAALSSTKTLADVVETNTVSWKKNANEWRDTVNDIIKLCATQADHDLLKERMDKMEGSSSGKQDLKGWGLAAFSTVLAIIMAVLAWVNSAWNHGAKGP